jgi:hypothetical protein
MNGELLASVSLNEFIIIFAFAPSHVKGEVRVVGFVAYETELESKILIE